MSSSLVPGSLFAGRYRVVRRIAAGGMGAVYEVIHVETERRRALKVMLPHVLQSPELRERFQREAKVAARVESDFIVDVFDAGFDEGTAMPFLVMELLHGEELGKRLKRLGRFSSAEVIAVLQQTAIAFDKTHRANIVHRDLKPENLFLTERDDGPPRVKVLDFGIAKIIAESATAGGGTQSIGTPLYMAPEQLDPTARLTGAADRYALGMVTYSLLVGVPYWGEEAKAGSSLALAMVAVHGPRDPASARAARAGAYLPAAFDGWFARATARDPAQRFATCVEMIQALAVALAEPAADRGVHPPVTPIALDHEEAATIALGARPAPVPPRATSTAPATATTAAPARASRPILGLTLGFVVLAGAALLALPGRRPSTRPAVTSTPPESPASGAPADSFAAPPASAALPTLASSPPTASAPAPVATTTGAPAASAPPARAPAGNTATSSVPASGAAAASSAARPAPTMDPERRKMWKRD